MDREELFVYLCKPPETLNAFYKVAADHTIHNFLELPRLPNQLNDYPTWFRLNMLIRDCESRSIYCGGIYLADEHKKLLKDMADAYAELGKRVKAILHMDEWDA